MEGFGLGALVFGILSWIAGMGMGDVKLVAAIGAWVGPQQLVIAMVLTAMAGGLIALAVAIVGGLRGDVWKSRKIPYAPAIAIGTLISFFSR
jgi:prepilin peptidase CpaA